MTSASVGMTDLMSSDASEGSVDSTASADEDAFVFRDDAWDGEFALGDTTDLTWNGGTLELDGASNQAVFTSRVFAAPRPALWHSLKWEPRAPYGKPLPDAGVVESGYEFGGADMMDNVLLLHFEEDQLLDAGAMVLDSSGNSTHGTVAGPGPMGTDSGIFGQSIVDPQDMLRVEFPPGPVAPGELDFTWAMWVRPTECTATSSWLALDESAPIGEGLTTIWLGCAPLGIQAGVLHGASGGWFVTTAGDLAKLDRWHHVAMVVNQTASQAFTDVEILIYLDGVLHDDYITAVSGPLDTASRARFYVGGQPAIAVGESLARGRYDEVALWNRALSEADIDDLFHRGARSVSLKVRACDDEACEGEEFVGPLGDPDLAYIDESLNPEDLEHDLPELVGPYVQYRMVFARMPGVISPKIAAVEIRGEPVD